MPPAADGARRRSKPAAGICAATSASATSSFKSFDIMQTNAAFVWPASWRIDQKDIKDTLVRRLRHRLPVEQLAALRRHRRISRRRRSSRRSAATPSSARAAAASTSMTAIIRAWRGPGQRLSRSRHLVVPDAVRRRRRRRRLPHDPRLHATSASSPTARRLRLCGVRRRPRRSGTSPGRCTPASPTRSRNKFKIELAYRYLNFGNGETGDIDCASAAAAPAADRAPTTPSTTSTRTTSSSACAGCCSRSRSQLMRRR